VFFDFWPSRHLDTVSFSLLQMAQGEEERISFLSFPGSILMHEAILRCFAHAYFPTESRDCKLTTVDKAVDLASDFIKASINNRIRWLFCIEVPAIVGGTSCHIDARCAVRSTRTRGLRVDVKMLRM
jgi:hypothetical protein